ncbi:tetratricopeptide repeat protein [Methylogaea oryzae]|uniref:Sel1 repeat family protein n=1 Tax=Methylogaea oryzae TaxID=1295382 RepID=A0A8D4VN48_9GAMM|nr:tetratricopeptide repeat protein [Methylogaea oryzae]BBL70641.1 hypothetical protein MoryE10_12470 [Methylogaea oryzae]
MSYISFFIAGAAAYFAHRYAVRRWLRTGKTVEYCLKAGSAVLLSTFAALFLALPTEWPMPQSEQGRIFSDSLKKAEQGDAKAEYFVGLSYAQGETVAADKAKAVLWMRKSAEQGYSDAQVALGNMYLNGRYAKEGVPKDYAQGKELLRKAADQGHVWAKMLLYNMEYEEKRQNLEGK